ncbi:hypothetical protein L6164_037003 [Bauhinia variegata]|uniref:Uncharacterized protein n=1 Tax=Bauhinia variegata TaxID=167791 RepID=A0ACB9KIR8_BAUVA|nr:hypothetical protein L6164_037003 [Bauhinia variegata]
MPFGLYGETGIITILTGNSHVSIQDIQTVNQLSATTAKYPSLTKVLDAAIWPMLFKHSRTTSLPGKHMPFSLYGETGIITILTGNSHVSIQDIQTVNQLSATTAKYPSLTKVLDAAV